MIADRWGVTEAEVSRAYPCDALVTEPAAAEVWRGVTVHAPVRRVWPWVTQIRLAPYSYDLLDNRGRRSPRRLAGLAEPVVGEPFTASGGRPLGRVLAVSAPQELTGEILGALMSYVLVPEGPDTRLLLKVVFRRGRTVAPLLSLGDLVMARRQLLNFARLAEGCAESG